MAWAGFDEVLRCPETRQVLTIAPPELLQRMRVEQEAGRLFNKAGKQIVEPLAEGLINVEGKLFYPVVNDIPVLLKDEAIFIAV